MEENQLTKLKEDLLEKLAVTGWDKVLKAFVYSTDFDVLIRSLYGLKEQKKLFTPDFKYIFNAFFKCPYKDLKVIFIGNEPYVVPDLSDGILFSSGLTNKPQPSIKPILEAVNETVYNSEQIVPEDYYDLSRWSKQGVLMLHSALTTEAYKVDAHKDLWANFRAYLLDTLNLNNSNLQVIFIGDKTKDYEEYFDDTHKKYFVRHPLTSLSEEDGKWQCNNIFNEINDYLEQHNQTKIIW